MNLKIPIWVAAAILLIWLAILGGYTVWFQTRTWSPVEEPISLSPGSRKQAEFTLNRDGRRFTIELRATGKGVDQKQLACMRGSRSEECGDINPTSARWTLTDLSSSKVLHSTSEAGTLSGSIGSTGEQIEEIGEFRGEKGHRYRLEVVVIAAAPELANADSTLMVGIGDTSFESALIVEQLAIFVTPIVVVVCGGVIGVCLYLKRRATLATRGSAL